MLRMDGFEVIIASSYDEALAAWHPQAVYTAGGTDLLPNLKHRILSPATVIHLAVPGDARIIENIAGDHAGDPGEIHIGAGMTLSALAADPLIRRHLPALAEAAGLVAGPQLRSMGTLGGNVLLDTRCLYYNQTEFWRKSLGYCLKAEGTWCHVVGGPKTCVATQSSDTVPVLLLHDAALDWIGPEGPRTTRIRDLYRFNGMDHLQIRKGDLLTRIRVPLPAPGARAAYRKLRARASIDFPQLSVAALIRRADPADPGSPLADLQIVLGAINPQPKALRGLDALIGQPLTPAAVDQAAALAHQQCRPQGSVHGDTAWRRQMAAVYVRRMLSAWIGA